MREAILTALISPLVLLVAGFILTEILGPRLKKKDGQPVTAAPPVVGQTVDWADRAYQDLSDLLDRERGEHAACHTVMRGASLPIPHD